MHVGTTNYHAWSHNWSSSDIARDTGLVLDYAVAQDLSLCRTQ